MLFFDSLTGADLPQRPTKPRPPIQQEVTPSDLITHLTHRLVRTLERLFGL